jgi:hypothetical protein
MSWPLKEIPQPDFPTYDIGLQIGDCWRQKLTHEEDPRWGKFWHSRLNAQFASSGRDWVWVVLIPFGPPEMPWCIWSPDMRPSRDDDSGWTVTNAEDPARMTVSPSILIVDRYHGWIRDGEITDDCEGRTYS